MQMPNLALKTGRALQKKQTGLIHFCYQSEDRKTHDTIPVFENALFALSLFRSRLSDNVLEAKALIEKFLPFEKEGNFPVYLHDYPEQTDPYLGLKLFPVFFWIVHDFSHVIGDLKSILPACMERIVAKAKEMDLPPWAAFRLKAIEGQVGTFPQTVFDWGEGLVSLQIAEKRGAAVEEAIQKAASLWHPGISLYVGPVKQRHQDGLYPEVNLFDLFMSQWQKKMPKRVEALLPVHLKGALIRPRDVVMEEKPEPFIDHDPLFIAWGDHTLTLAKKGEESIDFYLNYHPDHEIFVDGEKATIFQEGQELEIRSKDLSIKISFSVEDGIYFGHLLRGNRPAQHATKGEDHFTAFDWRISIQTVREGKPPKLLVRVNQLSLQKEQEVEVLAHP
ncbi:MAG: hypothetical protein P0S96_04410 [Simkaniaceae bacterium]|nr:hypothetical protein [Candidatus Sacchlamyda saccharinae]